MIFKLLPAVLLLASSLGLFLLVFQKKTHALELRVTAVGFFVLSLMQGNWALQVKPLTLSTVTSQEQSFQGTLHQASWAQWQLASKVDQLATAQDWLKQWRAQQRVQISVRSQNDLRYWGLALQACMAQAKDIQSQTQAHVVAQSCTQRETLLKYRPR